MDKLEEKIGYRFKNRAYLETALTHSSYANEKHSGQCMSYERQEFLGDSVLGLATAEFLYSHEPMLPEGRMTRLRAELVCEASLHKTALMLGLGQYMRLGKGEENNGGTLIEVVSCDRDSLINGIIRTRYSQSAEDAIKTHQIELLKAENHPKAEEYEKEWAEFSAVREMAKSSVDRWLLS